MKKILSAFLGLALLASQVHAQGVGQLGSGQVYGNPTAAQAPGTSATLTAIIDRAIGSTRGSVLYRGASAWSALTPGTSGFPFVSAGAGADPGYAALACAGGGTGFTSYAIGDILYASGVCTLSKLADVATGNALISGGVGTAPSWGKIALATHVSGNLPNANLTSLSADNLLGNPTGGATTPTGMALLSCSTASSALTYNTTTHVFGCNSIAGAGTVTSVDASGGVGTVSGSAITATGTVQGTRLVNAQTGTTYTVLDSDRGKLVTHTNGSSIAVTLPQAGGGGTFLSGWFTCEQNRGVGTVTITPTTSTIDGAANIALGTGQGICYSSDGTNYFTERGRGITSVIASTGLTGGTITTSGTIAIDIATDTNSWSATANKIIDGAKLNSFTTPIGLTDAATIATDFQTGRNFTVTLGGNRTLGNPTNPIVGSSGCYKITQDGTGSRTLAYASNWKFAGGTAPTLSTAIAAVDTLCYLVWTSSFIEAALVHKDVK